MIKMSIWILVSVNEHIIYAVTALDALLRACSYTTVDLI